MTAVGEVLPLVIEKPAAGGRMIARAGGQVVLVSGAIPGERVMAVVERVSKGLAYAAVVDVVEPSPDRRRDASDPRCGGCLYRHIDYPRQLQLKSLVIADAFARIGRLELPAPPAVAASPETGYRMRARLHVRGRHVGFFREGTHEVCDARQTRQLLPATFDVLDRLAAAMRSLAVEAVGEIEVSENVDASDRVVHLESGRGAGLALELPPAVLDRLAATEGLTGLSTAHGTRGSVYVTDAVTVGDHPPVPFRRHVLAFFQANRYLLNQLVAHVVEQVPSGSDVVDLYAGVGLFAVAAAVARQAQVTAVEGERMAAADLAANAVVTRGAVVPVHRSVEEFLGPVSRVRHEPDRRRALIVDPPRTGMSREALSGVIQSGARRIVYVSCDTATLARDSRRLVDAGYTIGAPDAFDLFPNTPHVETVVVFDR